MAQAFSRLGSEVTIVEMSSQIMSREDSDVIELVKERFKKDKIKVLVNHKAISFKSNKLICDHKGKEKVIEFLYDLFQDEVLKNKEAETTPLTP